MKKYKIYREVKEILDSVVCDICLTEYDNILDIQEFLSYQDKGGFGSLIGDGVTWSIDICPKCVVKHLGDYIRRV